MYKMCYSICNQELGTYVHTYYIHMYLNCALILFVSCDRLRYIYSDF